MMPSLWYARLRTGVYLDRKSANLYVITEKGGVQYLYASKVRIYLDFILRQLIIVRCQYLGEL